MIGGRPMELYWLRLFFLTHQGAASIPPYARECWLDGRPLAVQCSFVVAVMGAIRAEFCKLLSTD
jgi:hypothetical protein